MFSSTKEGFLRRIAGDNVWLAQSNDAADDGGGALRGYPLNYEVIESERSVGEAQWEEILQAAADKDGDLVMVLLGGRGAQALHKLLGEISKSSEYDDVLGRLHVFTQDALAPLRMDNGFSFVRDFERLLGEAFFQKIKSFSPMFTDTADPEPELFRHLEKIQDLGGIDIFFLGLGPEAGGASHLAYIKPMSGAGAQDLAGIIPISPSILEHHISKFKAGGSTVNENDEAECRSATHILTLGPAMILGARRLIQSVVDAATAPAKRASYGRLLSTDIALDPDEIARQVDENPGLWIRLHPNVRSLILPDVLHF